MQTVISKRINANWWLYLPTATRIKRWSDRYHPARIVIKKIARFSASIAFRKTYDITTPSFGCYHYPVQNWHFQGDLLSGRPSMLEPRPANSSASGEYFDRSMRYQWVLLRCIPCANCRKPLRGTGLRFTVEFGGW
jgi:hypothetical protein